jgi:hypothetical protein
MSKPIPQKYHYNRYKNIIIDRLANSNKTTAKKNVSNIHSIKTQCTPNDKTQNVYEKIFEDF